ncbi:MAG: hypothetical protein AAGK97_18675, partial [Bacteroidota bacterium]
MLIPSSNLSSQNFDYTQWILDQAIDRDFTEYVYDTSYRKEMGGTDFYGPDSCIQFQYVESDTIPCVRLAGGIYTTKALAYMAMAAFFDSSAQSSNGVLASDRVVAHLNHICGGGEEPTCRGGGLSGHGDGTLALAIAFAKLNPTIWNQFSSDQIYRIDHLLRFLVFAANFSQNFQSANGQARGVLGHQSFLKSNNPNLVVGNVETMLAAYYFYGGRDNVNNVLANFDFDTYMNIADSLGFQNIVRGWSLDGINLWGKTKLNEDIKRPFTYEHQYPDFEPDGSIPILLKETEIPFDPFEIIYSLNIRNFYLTVRDTSALGY